MCLRDAKRKKEERELSTCGQTCVHLLYSFITIVAVQQAHASCTFSSTTFRSTASVVLVSLNLLIYRLILKTSSIIIVGTQNCTTNKIEEMMASRSSSTSSNKRKCFSLELKAEIISEVDKKKKTKAQICRDYDISSGTLYTFLRDREAILSAVSKGQFKPDRKRLKTTEYENLDHCLLVWFNQARACNTPISGPEQNLHKNLA